MAGLNSYRLGMNRDEKLARAIAFPPAQDHFGTREVLFPREPEGGTWVGVNDAGVTVALINWYGVPAGVAGKPLSRGELVRASLPSASPDQLHVLRGESPLVRVNPFRLIGVFPARRIVVEWLWNLERLERLDHPWRTSIWISSGVDEAGAQRTRTASFREALLRSSADGADWLRRLHRSHAPERGPYSTCMHREDAATVSYTEVAVSREMAALRYTPGAPCCSAPLPEQVLGLKR